MGKLKSVALSAGCGLLLAGSLSAQTATGRMAWRGVNGAWSCYSGGTVNGCFYTSPYHAAFQITSLPTNAQYLPPASASSSAFGPTQDIFCVDFLHDASTNSTTGIAVNFTNLGQDAADVGISTRLHGTAAQTLTDYLESAWLAQQILAEPSLGTANALDMNGAIWQIMSGFPVYRNGVNTQIAYWVGQAALYYHTQVDPNRWVVVTDQLAAGNNTSGTQEFLTQVTPEPATLLLLGTGLLLMMMGAGAVKRLSA